MVLCLSTAVSGQLSIGANVNASMPMDKLGDGYQTGYGGTATLRYGVTPRFSVGANFGAQFFRGNNQKSELDDAKLRIVPITALFEVNLLTGVVQPYLGADIGVYNISTK